MYYMVVSSAKNNSVFNRIRNDQSKRFFIFFFNRVVLGRVFDNVTVSRDMNEVRKPCSHLEKELSRDKVIIIARLSHFNVWEGFVFMCVKVEKVLELLMNPKCFPVAHHLSEL